MHKLYELKEKLIEEMENYAGKPNLSKDDVMYVKYLSSSVDHICNILEKADDEEYSNRGYSRRRYSIGDRMMNENSYARRRDAMGRYSRAGEDFRMELQELIQDAPNDHIRQKMQSIMSEI